MNERDFNAAFRRVLGRALVVAGVGTAAQLSIMGGCVPADCGEFSDQPRSFTRDDALEEDVARSLAEFSGENPDATARLKLAHLYGTLDNTAGVYDPDSQFTDVAITLLGELAAEEGSIDTATCDHYCGYYSGVVDSCEVVRSKETRDPSLLCSGADKSGCVGGREPAGLTSNGVVPSTDPRGAYWAYICHLEACAVHAFAALHQELVHHGAPEEIRRGVLRALHDELVHVQLTARLARRFGAEPTVAEVERPASRSLLKLAEENAREGCIREAFGALEMHVQSQLTDDAEVAAVFQRIATDETFHAQLSWQIDSWALGELGDDARNVLDDAKREALDRLRTEVSRRRDQDTQAVAIPTGTQARQLLDVLEQELLAA